MRFLFDRSDFAGAGHGEQTCFLLTDGLGGCMSASAAFSATRCDQGLLVAARSPSRRYTLVHRLREELVTGEGEFFLSTQSFADGRPPEEGWRSLVSFTVDDVPEWTYEMGGVRVVRRCGMEQGKSCSAVTYTVENGTGAPCTLRVSPVFQMAQKGEPPQERRPFTYGGGRTDCAGLTAFISASVPLKPVPAVWEALCYADDEKDGRRASGLGYICCEASLTVPAGESGQLEIVFSAEKTGRTGREIVEEAAERRRTLLKSSGFTSPEAMELARAADAFIVHRASTGGKTVIAGYPFFGDWGRDTMIALPGCALATGRFDDARSILRTFLSYERDGLLPNCFPEGQEEPQYNSADAPLLFINCVWLYYQKTGDAAFVREAWPVLKRIVGAYMTGTRYAISMDSDGLIRAGEGLDQVTWMDVRIGEILPTPRHGKPVEINACWYSGLRAMERLATLAGEDGAEFGALAVLVKRSFNEEFWMEERGYLKDVLSGTAEETQLRCNQIWAVTMPFTMLSPERERRVTEAVGKYLYTPFGLRTLSPEDPAFHPFYGGPQRERDLAYHQGTVWPFPLGAYYLALLKVGGGTPEAARRVRSLMSSVKDILREGCVGQLPEIYDGLEPGPSKGCFAQAWSVGELLRVYERLEEIEN